MSPSAPKKKSAAASSKKKKSDVKKTKAVVKPKALAKKDFSLETLPAPLEVATKDIQKTEALQAYLQNLKRYSLLSLEKERKLTAEYFKTRDPQIAQILILSNLRLVVKIAYEYWRSGIHVLDLIQEGNIGLLQAVKEYDPHKGAKLSSYASYWIKAYIRAFIIRNWSLVKMGTTRAQRALFYKLQKEKAKLEAQGINPDVKLLSDRLHVTEKDVVEMSQRMSGRDVSLNAPLRTDDGDSNEGLLQFLKDDSIATDEKLAEDEVKREFSERLNAFERTLAGKELIIFRERMRSETPKTLQEIADVYGITRERIRQIESRVLEKLKAYMKENAKFKDSIIDV